MNKEEAFQQNRSELVNIAYGMLGNLSDAQDIVQDAYIKWDDVNIEKVDNPRTYLKTIVSRLCIDRFRSAKHQREEYIGPWLPQPVADSDGELPDSNIQLHDQLTIALLHVLENLSADQRAIYLLHDVFDYPFSEIAELLGKKSATCRKAAQRARESIKSNNPPEASSFQESEQIVEDFIEALRSRDITKLQQLITDDAVMYSDGGGKANAVPKPVESLDKVSKFLISIANKTAGQVSIEQTIVNNRPGFRAYMDGQLQSIWSFDIQDRQIRKIFSILNPDKL
ncbi:MAG: RNA polymerase sigma factor SigJ [Balneolaceae bacterium]|nr:RNA polymerase sigma factor SigJ [Balneolaceae bacterium]